MTTAILLGLVVLAFVGTLFFFQSQIIYHPRPYPPAQLEDAKEILQIRYQTSQGEQTSFYMPAKALGKPEVIWFFFGGNGSLALDWKYFLERYPNPKSAFVFLEYPGYGLCNGKASPASIDESSKAVFTRITEELGSLATTEINVLGNSLGGAPALTFALERAQQGQPVKKIVLVAPFTTMKAMAGLTVGPVLANLLLHPFDNTGSLQRLLQDVHTPKISIYHGTNDEVIPFRMGEELSKLDPLRIQFHSYAGESHNTVLGAAQNDIFSFMTEP